MLLTGFKPWVMESIGSWGWHATNWAIPSPHYYICMITGVPLMSNFASLLWFTMRIVLICPAPPSEHRVDNSGFNLELHPAPLAHLLSEWPITLWACAPVDPSLSCCSAPAFLAFCLFATPFYNFFLTTLPKKWHNRKNKTHWRDKGIYSVKKTHKKRLLFQGR